MGRRIFHRAKRSGAAELRAFLAFLRNPDPEPTNDLSRGSRIALWFWLFLFAITVTVTAGLLALPLIITSDATPGDNLLAAFDQPPVAVILTIVLLGPLIEEMIFRGWLTGTLRAMGGVTVFLAVVFGGPWLLRRISPDAITLGTQVALAVTGIALFIAIQRYGSDASAIWYRRIFPLVFWAQGAVFGGLHFANIANGPLALSLVAVTPLVICGWLWGYARLTLGFGAAWLLHAAYNVPSVAAMLAMTALRPN